MPRYCRSPRLGILSICFMPVIVLWALIFSAPQTASAQPQPAAVKPATSKLATSNQTTINCALLSDVSQLECEAVLALYASTDGPNWITNTGWMKTSTICQWHGIVCRDNRIVMIVLARNGLRGTLPAELGDLRWLEVLNLGNEAVTTAPEPGQQTRAREDALVPSPAGPLSPATAAAMIDIADYAAQVMDESMHIRQTIVISQQLAAAGIIPPETITDSLATLNASLSMRSRQLVQHRAKLAAVSASELNQARAAPRQDTCLVPVNPNVPATWNILSGDIPASLTTLTRLIVINLAFSQICGTVPTDLTELAKLEILNLRSNRIGGLVPADLSQLTRLSELNLSDNYLTGQIPVELTTLPQLKTLSLSTNLLSGPIPRELGNLSTLTELYLSSNQFFGPIPMELGALTELTWLDLSFNQLSGEIPSQLRNLRQLNALLLDHNNLSGSLPTWLGELTNLLSIGVVNNQLSGPLPKELAQAQNLILLFVANNRFSGPIPPELGNLPILQSFWADFNELTGSLPASFAQLANLERLSVSENGLTGALPAWLGSLSKLEWIVLTGNELSGPIPPEIGNLTNLTILRLEENQLTGTIPPTLGNLKKLESFWLSDNDLRGTIPTTLADMPALTIFGIGQNRLTGTIPDGLRTLSAISFFDLSANRLRGPIPPWLGELSNISGLLLQQNQFTGVLPAELGRLTQLNFLSFNENLLTGSLPRELGALTQLHTLLGGFNQLTGPLPAEVGNMAALSFLSLQGNQLSGPLPAALGNLGQMEQIFLEENFFSGPIPPELGNLAKLRNLDIWDNQLTGQIPPELGQLTQLSELWLSGNRLKGPLPPELGNLSNLSTLALHRNSLSGSMPDWLGSLTNLSRLFLQQNQFAGEIPASLTNLTRLAELNLDFNKLESSNPAVLTFLDNMDLLWHESQTVAPTDVQAAEAAENALAISWQPLTYTGDRGHIVVEFATVAAGPFTAHGRTPDKTSQGYAARGLDPETTYYFRLRTFTPAHGDQRNDLWSNYSTVISATTSAAPTVGDPHEDDNSCAQAKTIIPNGVVWEHSLHRTDDVDWVRFAGQTGVPYRVEIQIPENSAAIVALESYLNCNADPESNGDTFSYGARLVFTPVADGPIYLKITGEEGSPAGENVTYRLSVRGQEQAAKPGALILLAGRLRTNDRLQPNIHKVTNQVYDLFRQAGYSDDEIYYLATDETLPGYDAAATAASLRRAITTWAADKVSADAPLTLYLMDHGDQGKLYLDKPNDEIVTPAQLNSWLSDLERQHADLYSNIIIEACYAGSFLKGAGALSGENRVIVSSTSSDDVAYASQTGAHFSDHFLTALRQGHHIFSGFWEARTAVQASHSRQTPWLDADGDGIPNTLDDAAVAAQRGYILPTSALESRIWPPFIKDAQVSLVEGQIVIAATVEQREPIARVWVTVERPDYVPPESSDQMVPEELPIVELTDPDGDGIFRGAYTGVDKEGRYRVVVYAQDEGNLRARPATSDVANGEGDEPDPGGSTRRYQVYLPVVSQVD